MSRAALPVLDHALLALLTPDGIVVAAGAGARGLDASGLDASGLDAGDPDRAIVGLPFAETGWWAHDPELSPRIRDAVMAAARSGGGPVRLEAGLRGRNGRLVPVELTVAPLYDGGECPSHLAVSVRGLADMGADAAGLESAVPDGSRQPSPETDGFEPSEVERARLRRQLAVERARFSAVVEQIPVGILLADAPDGRILFGNAQMTEILGHPVLLSPNVDAYDNWVGWHADGRRVENTEWPLARALRGEIARGDFHYQRGDGTRIWIRVRGAPIRDASGAIVGSVVVINDIDAEKRAEQALRDSNRQKAELLEQFESMMANAPVGLAVFDAGHRYVRVNDTMARINGIPAEAQIGRTVDEVLPTIGEEVGRTIDHVLATGESIANIEIVGETPAAPGLERHWVASFYPVSTEGRVSHVGNIVVEITSRWRAEARQRALLDELSHRVKNTLATVQSLATQSLRDDPSPAAFARAFSGRLRSLAYTHDLLAQSGWRGARLADLVRAALGPLQSAEAQRLVTEGPDIGLTPTAALTFGLALHELAVNAAAHGALSVPGGRVEVRWAVTGEAPRLELEWRETDGPPVSAPARRGFGLRFIERSFAHELDGEASFEFAPDGLVCRIAVSWAEAGETERRYMSLQEKTHESPAAWSRPG